MTSSKRAAMYRDKEKWKAQRQREKDKYYRKTGDEFMSGERWSDEDIDLMIRSKLTDKQLSEKLGRTVRAVQVKRSKLRSRSGKRIPSKGTPAKSPKPPRSHHP